MADGARDAHVVGCSAWRRRNRRLSNLLETEQQAVRMAVAAATHHTHNKSMAHARTQTDAITADETSHMPVVVQEVPDVQVVERIQDPIVEPIEPLLHEHVQLHTAIQIVHVSVPRIQQIPQEHLPERIAEQIVPERIEEQIGETIEVLQRSITAVEVSVPQVDSSRPSLSKQQYPVQPRPPGTARCQ